MGGCRVKVAAIAADGGAGLVVVDVTVEPDCGKLREEGEPDPRPPNPTRRKSSRSKTDAERSLI